MKYLSHYIETGQTAAFEKHGAFFAFSIAQFNKKKKSGVTYVNMGAGMLCPKDSARELAADLDEVHEKGIEEDIAENGIPAIIDRELANHECYYTGDWTDAAGSLVGYKITDEQFRAAWGPYVDRCAGSW